MANSVLQRDVPYRWHYECGLMHRAIQQVWLKTGEARYYDFIQRDVNAFVDDDGRITTYSVEEYNLDQINPGRSLFVLHRQSGEDKYKRAALLLREQLRGQPRTQEGGFWHKNIYPHQMWLDGLYMAAPFYAEYARTFDEPAAFDDILHQFEIMEQHARDPQTGLLYHAWDESRQQAWANPQTGCSPHFWGRAMGWYGMALVDVLDHFPEAHAGRAALVELLRRFAPAVRQVQAPDSGLWYQVLDQGRRPGNYLETSASAMFVYTLAKGVRKAYLPPEFAAVAERGYQGLIRHKLEVADQGLVNLKDICSVGGLGGEPYRDGSFAYYVSEKIVSNDYKGVGAFILASLEMEARAGRPA